jgi:hypothetical protein
MAATDGGGWVLLLANYGDLIATQPHIVPGIGRADNSQAIWRTKPLK